MSMYHEQTYHDAARLKRRNLFALLALVVFVVSLLLFAALSKNALADQSSRAIRESVVDAAVQCCAVEGSYPSDIVHLENYYGLVLNRTDYVIVYEWLGDNVPPSVVVRHR